MNNLVKEASIIFPHKRIQKDKVTWMSPNLIKEKQIDHNYILSRKFKRTMGEVKMHLNMGADRCEVNSNFKSSNKRYTERQLKLRHTYLCTYYEKDKTIQEVFLYRKHLKL